MTFDNTKVAIATTFNVPTLLAVAGVFATIVTGWNALGARIEKIEQSRGIILPLFEAKFADLSTRLSILDTIPYRVAVAEGRIEETGKRIDRLSESIVAALETIRKDVAGLSTRVEVLTGKIDALADRKQADLRKTPMELR